MAGRRFDAPGLSDALVGVTLMSDAIADMCGDDEEWEGSPQKGMRKKFLKISGRLKQYAEDGARAAHMHMAVAARYDQEYGAPAQKQKRLCTTHDVVSGVSTIESEVRTHAKTKKQCAPLTSCCGLQRGARHRK